MLMRICCDADTHICDISNLPAEDHANAYVVDLKSRLRRHSVAVEQLGESDGFKEKNISFK